MLEGDGAHKRDHGRDSGRVTISPTRVGGVVAMQHATRASCIELTHESNKYEVDSNLIRGREPV